jgi:beta-glucosidase
VDSYYTEDVFVGYRGYEEFGIAPQYAFGHGLSYTTFEYSGLTVRSESQAKVAATFTVTNTGDRAGVETPQVYVGELPTTVVDTAPKQLAGFTKVSLAPGQSKTVTVNLDRESFSYWDSYVDSWITPRGRIDLMVGSSSKDTRLTESVQVNSSDKENESGLSTEAVYTIVNENSGACLDAVDYGTSNGTAVQQWACPAPQPNAQWTLSKARGGAYRITNVNAGLVLQVADSSKAQDAPLQLWEAPRSLRDLNQSFTLVRVGDGYYQLVNQNSGLCAAVDGGTRDNGVLITQETCSAQSAAQSFALRVQGG